ncbi:MAG: hypothetical protein PWP48_378 [Clostridiales bacterium]|nr:hypothetical protein [Clostridiales bacterium]
MKHRFIWLVIILSVTASGCAMLSPARPSPTPPAPQISDAVQQQEPADDTKPELNRPRYEMSLVLDTEKNTISGQETIFFKNTGDEPLNDIYLQLYQNTDERLTEIQKIMLDEAEVKFEYSANTVVIQPPKPIYPWKKVKLDIFFTSNIPVVTDKLGDYGYKNGVYALSRFYPSLAARSDSGWIISPYYYTGDPYISDAADYDVKLSMPAKQKAVFGGHVEYDTVEGDRRLVHVTASPARTFCFAASANYKTVSKKVGDITVTAAYANGSPAVAQSMLDYAEHALSIFQKRFGIYPYDYMVLAEAPLRSGGMEYSGIALYAPAVFRGRDVEREVVHEIAHQWWFNMVGNDEFREPWLDEGLTRYSEVIYYESRYGAQRKQQALNKISQRLKTTSDGVLYSPISGFSKSQYYIVVYDKGALFHDALRQQMGDDSYFKLLQEYLRRYKWKIATTQDFQRLAAEICGDTDAIDKLFEQWIYE